MTHDDMYFAGGFDTNLFIDWQMLPFPLHDAGGFRDDIVHCRRTTWDVIEYTCISRTILFTRYEFLETKNRANEHHERYQSLIQYRVMKMRQTIRENLKDTRKWRFKTYTSPTALKRVKEFCKEFGSVIVRNDDPSEIISSLNEYHAHDIVTRCFNGATQYNDELNDLIDRCDDCGEFFFKDDGYGSSRDFETICQTCLDDHYHFSECMCEYVPETDACPVYSSYRAWENGSADDWCLWRYGNNNFYEHEGSYFVYESDRDEAAGYGDEDEEEEDTPQLRHWHQTARNFVEINNSKKWPSLGMELEVYAQDRYSAVEDLQQYDGKMIMERDGSLDDYHGFEIITQPLGREEWDKFLPSLTHTLKQHKIVGYNEPAGHGYGIHITIHRRHFSPLAEARISLFMGARENQNFLRALAQRKSIYSPMYGYDMGEYEGKLKISSINNDGLSRSYTRNCINGQRKIVGKGKYAPVNWKVELAEFRLFQSTVNPSSIEKDLEFIWALQRWTCPQAATGSSYHYHDFLKWLNKAENRNDYPQLVAFLSKKTFYGTNYEPIVSTWQHLMVKPVETEAVEPMAA